MSVFSIYDREIAQGDGVNLLFGFTWKFVAPEDIFVYVDDVLQAPSLYTIKNPITKDSGSVTFLTPPAVGAKVVIRRMDNQQQARPFKNQETFNAHEVEKAFDKLTLLVQEGFEELRRSGLRMASQSNLDYRIENLNIDDGMLALDLNDKMYRQTSFTQAQVQLVIDNAVRSAGLTVRNQEWDGNIFKTSFGQGADYNLIASTNMAQIEARQDIHGFWYVVWSLDGQNWTTITSNAETVLKADKVQGAVAGNLAGLDIGGNLTDAGVAPEALERIVNKTAIPAPLGSRSDTKYLSEKAALDYTDEKVAEISSGLFFGSYWFGYTGNTPGFIIPNPTIASQNYFDFTSNSVYVGKPDLSGWTLSQTFEPINGSRVSITAEFWDLAADAGKSGSASFSDTQGWGYSPIPGQTLMDGVTLVPRVSDGAYKVSDITTSTAEEAGTFLAEALPFLSWADKATRKINKVVTGKLEANQGVPNASKVMTVDATGLIVPTAVSQVYDTDPLGSMYISDGLLSGAEAIGKKLAGEWVTRAAYPDFYDKFVANFNLGVAQSDVVNTRQGSLDTTSPIYTVNYLRGSDGRKYIDFATTAAVAAADNIFSAGFSAPYYIVDTVLQQIRLPRYSTFPRFTSNLSAISDLQTDNIVNVVGQLFSISEQFGDSGTTSGAFVKLANGSQNTPTFSGAGNDGRATFDASRVVRTGGQVQPRSVLFVVYFKVGSNNFTNIPVDLAAQLQTLLDRANYAGQIRVGYTGLSQVNFAANVAKQFVLGSAATTIISPSPTTIYPKGSSQDYATIYDSVSGKIHEYKPGQPVKWRLIGTYANKAAANNGELLITITNPTSGFSIPSSRTLPSGKTSGDWQAELTTIGDNSSIGAGLGYFINATTSFADANLSVSISSLTAFYAPLETSV